MAGCLSSVLSRSLTQPGRVIQLEDVELQHEPPIVDTTTRPHRVLEMDDILSPIFEAVIYPSTPYYEFHAHLENKRTLARAARVCKAFSKPALSVLWRTIDDVLPLFRVLSCIQILYEFGHAGSVYVGDIYM